MTKPLLITGAHLIDPSQNMDKRANLLLEDQKVAWIGEGEPPKRSYNLIQAEGLVVCPGFVDLHCHLREPGFEEKETIATGSRAAAKGGYTTICCMPNTNPPLDNQSSIDYVKGAAEREGVVRVLPIGCISKGRRGEELVEMEELFKSGVVGFSDDGSPVASSRLMRQALEYSLSFGLAIISHCEDLALSEGGQMNEGIISTRLGLPGIPAAAEEVILARDLILAKLTGARLHVAHVSTEGSVELIKRAKDKGVRVTAEVTPHHLVLTEERVIGYDTNAKVNPPLRTKKDAQALLEGLKEGVIDAIATDHAPHTEVDKLCEFALAPFGISGLETAFGSLMELVHEGKLDLKVLISKLTWEPAKIIGERFGKLGTLALGSPADVTIFDPSREWQVSPDDFASKGKNTPFKGSTFKGKVVMTISRGKIVYKDEKIRLKA